MNITLDDRTQLGALEPSRDREVAEVRQGYWGALAHGDSTRIHRAGFTMIEMMVVVAIIGLLVAILMPAFGKVRTQARVTQTISQFLALDTGLATLQSVSELGGSLPPSGSDNPADRQLIANPKKKEGGNNGASDVRISGAHLLVQAMMGADGLGTPGFRDYDRDGFWWNDTHNNSGGAYEIDETTAREKRTRYGGGGYVDDKMKETAKSLIDLENQGTLLNLANAPTETGVEEPMFTDPWNGPILYYRAGRGSQRMISDPASNVSGIYRLEDNAIITGMDKGSYQSEGMDFGAGKVNGRYHAVSVSEPPLATEKIAFILDDEKYNDSFARFILNPQVKVRPTPVREDKYLLISAGPDSRYGTDDDVINWKRAKE